MREGRKGSIFVVCALSSLLTTVSLLCFRRQTREHDPCRSRTMLALKKKREAEKAEAEKKPEDSGDKVSLLGIAGKKKAADKNGTGKKRTPGEIRIQKGTKHSSCR